MHTKAIPLSLIAALAGCQSTGAPPAPPPPPIACSAGPDCEAKWSRAVAWVTENAAYKIQTQTDYLIETYNAVDSGSTGLMASVNKVSVAPGKFEIRAHFGCRNMFGCAPRTDEALQKFARTVNG